MQPLQTCIGPIIRIGRESWCLPYAGFLLLIWAITKGSRLNTLNKYIDTKHNQNYNIDVIMAFMPYPSLQWYAVRRPFSAQLKHPASFCAGPKSDNWM